MPPTYTCPCGHTWVPRSQAGRAYVRCPNCGVQRPVTGRVQRRKGFCPECDEKVEGERIKPKPSTVAGLLAFAGIVSLCFLPELGITLLIFALFWSWAMTMAFPSPYRCLQCDSKIWLKYKRIPPPPLPKKRQRDDRR